MNGKHINDLSDQSKPNVIIYAGDGGCYWRENSCGYTNAQMAGVYTREEAYRVAGHCGPEKRVEFHSVPADHVPTLKAALREAKESMQSLPCRCRFLFNCPVCGSHLVEGVDQFTDSWICGKCVTTMDLPRDKTKPCGRCAALARIEEVLRG